MNERERNKEPAGSWPFEDVQVNIEALIPAARDRLVTISDRSALTEAAARLGVGDTDLVIVCNEAGEMVGVVSKTDVLSRISQCEGHACSVMVASVMSRRVVCCRPDDPLRTTWTIMNDEGFSHIPVVDDDGRPLGTLYAGDVLQVLLREVEHEENLLRDYVTGIGYR